MSGITQSFLKSLLKKEILLGGDDDASAYIFCIVAYI
jgi:hypothetical protein